MQVEEAADKVKKSQTVLKEFKSNFQKYKSMLSSYFKGDKKPKTWDFQVGGARGKNTNNKRLLWG